MARKRTALLIGATSFIGKHLSGYLADQGMLVVGTSHKPTKGRQWDERVRLVRCDARQQNSLKQVINRYTPDQIYYLAALSNVRLAWQEPLKTLEVNFIGGVNLLEIMRHSNSKARVVFFSSGTVYGMSHMSGKRMKETTCMLPKDPYGLSKLGIDYFARFYARVYKLKAVTVRLANLVGPGQSKVFSLANFGYQIAGIKAGKLKPAMRVGSMDAKRDYLDIRDAVEAIYLTAQKGKLGESYNVGTGIGRSLQDVLDTLIRLAGLNKEAIKVRRNPAYISKDEIKSMRLDSTKLTNLTGWKPKTSFRKTLNDILDYWSEEWHEN